MKAITFHGVEKLAFEEVPDPPIVHPSDVIVRVTHAGVCGSDLHPYFGREVGLDVGTVMGHEMVGEIVEAGSEVSGFSVGDAVVSPFSTNCGDCFYCRTGLTARCERGELFGWVEDGVGLHGCQAEYVRVPFADTTLVALPDGLDEGLALLAGDILSTAAFAADLAEIREGDVVAIVGSGPVGLLSIRTSLALGAGAVVAIDRVPSRLEMAAAFGARTVQLDVDPVPGVVYELTEGRGADAAIEAVGSREATELAARLLRPGARLAAVGVHTEPHLAISPGELYDRNLTYAAGRCSARRYLPSSLRIASGESELLGTLISHRLPLERGEEAYRRFAAREAGWNKVILEA